MKINNKHTDTVMVMVVVMTLILILVMIIHVIIDSSNIHILRNYFM